MLENLHVKNLALIEEADIDFTDHLNILTGETGAGKSILLGSMNLALGGRMSKDMIRPGAKEALVELVFYEDREEVLEKLALLDIYPEEKKIIISRRCSAAGRTSTKVNGENITLSALKAVGNLLLDIHSQHENQSLMDKAKHLEILDQYGGEEEKELQGKLEKVYASYTGICEKLKQMEIPEEQRLREKAFLQYEMAEIENAGLKEGEEEELEEAYRKMRNSSKIAEGLGSVLELMEDGVQGESVQTAGELLLHSLRTLRQIQSYDSELLELSGELEELEALFGQFTSDVRHYLDGVSYDPARLSELEERLNQIRSIKARYGSTEEEVKRYYQKISEKWQMYEEYEENKKQLEAQKDGLEAELEGLCEKLSKVRRKAAGHLTVQIAEALRELNFLDVKFEIDFRRLSHFTKHGYDEVEFMISTNPGQECRPLGKIASGGELSRIMLALKSVMADKDQIGTLIFDEIDTGISGRTAQKVSEKLADIAKNHQVLCITHLPQIAAMADSHFKIEKSTDGNVTTTTIVSMGEKDSIDELARMLGGAQITQAVWKSAEEMRRLAGEQKGRAGG
jgi:DNA repair protein RecN (Recombination protein N)